MMITRGQLRAGELVLILGASGGVGTGCVQIAKNLKAPVIACASSADKLRRLQELGADHVIDYTKEDFSKRAWEISGKKGVDVLVNYTGGDTWVPSLRTLARHGRLLEGDRVRHVDQVVGVHRDALAEAPVGVLAQGAARLDVRVDQHTLADPVARHAGPHRVHHARDVATRDARHLDRQAGHAVQHEDVEVVQPAGLHLHHRLARPCRGLRPVAAQAHLLQAAVSVDRDCLQGFGLF